MIAKTRQKISQLRQQPEHIRLRAAIVLSAGIGTALAVISLAVLLPLQLYFLRGQSKQVTAKSHSSEANIGGITDIATTQPAISPTPTFSP